jgi:GNAT superfamily N-acetyltransferase
MSIEVRDARLGDKGRCRELLSALSAATGSKSDTSSNDSFEKLITQERGQIIVAVEGSEILGMATVSYNLAMRYGGEYCQLEELIVDPKARGKNIGGLLTRRTVENAKARGCAEFGLYLVESTEHNRPFYEKHGFVVVGTEMRQRLD